jgi:hypothetical protein
MKGGRFGQSCGVCTDVARGSMNAYGSPDRLLGVLEEHLPGHDRHKGRIEWVTTNHEVFHRQSKTVTFTVLKGTSRSHSR